MAAAAVNVLYPQSAIRNKTGTRSGFPGSAETFPKVSFRENRRIVSALSVIFLSFSLSS